MKLFLIRHAESTNNRLALDLGYDEYMRTRSIDPPISELGTRQAQLLADHLAANAHPESAQEKLPVEPFSGYGITHVYCSPMLRTLQTAQPVAAALGVPVEVWVDIHEHGGMFLGNPRTGEGLVIHGGMARLEIEASFPGYALPAAITEAGWWTQGYEDMPGCFARAIRVARTLRHRAQDNRAEGRDEAVALISHGNFLDALIKAFFEQAPGRRLFYQHYNTAITRLDFMPDGLLMLRYLNRTMHLPPEMFSI